MAERLKAAVLKTVMDFGPSRVRISTSPPYFKSLQLNKLQRFFLWSAHPGPKGRIDFWETVYEQKTIFK